MFSSILVAVSLLSALGAQATLHSVKVGAGGLVFDPAKLDGVANGDDIEFVFQAKNHTVTQSTFADPCTAKPGGANSGFVNTTAAAAGGQPTWTITVNNASDPLWFYCKQKTPVSHCAMGMVFSVNPTAEKSADAFVAKAKATNATAAAPAGGAAAPAGGAAAPAGGAAAPAASPAAAGAAPATAAAANSDPQPNGARTMMAGGLASVLAIAGVVATLV
jgi:hypothetical protein